MKKLKNLLQSNLFLFFLFSITVLLIGRHFQQPLYENSKLGLQKVVGIVRNVEKDEAYTRITIKDTIVTVKNGTFELGEKVSCYGEVTVPTGQRNFYLFDYQKYLASKKIYYRMQAECESISKNTSFLYHIKNKILQTIDNRKSSAYLNAFLLGNTKSIESSVKESYQINGISHLFAVSGMHISFFVLLFGFLIKKEKIRDITLFFFFVFYLFLTDFSPSVMRASLFFFFAKGLKRFGYKTIQSYLLFTMLILWYQPYFLYHTGFLYSFTISFFLILFSSFFADENNYWKKILKLSSFSFLASIPIQIQTNFSLNFFSIFYNLLFVPVVSAFFFPCSFLAFFFSFFDPFYFFMIRLLENISVFLSKVSCTFQFCHLPFWGVMIYYGVLTFVMHKVSKKAYRYSVILFLLLGIHFLYPYWNTKGMILMMDVGQGDSILIVYPHRKLTILVDTGGSYYDTDIAINTIVPTLYAHGISSLDYLILSHGDLDHIGEVISLLQNIKVKKVLLNSGSDTAEEKNILSYLEKKNISYQKLSKETITDQNQVLQFLNNKREEDENEDSLVCYLKIMKYSILFMGDSGIETEKELLEEYNIPPLDILKVGHHGSKYSSGEEFLSEMNPKVCLISAGENNRYGHPHKETLMNLKFCDTYITGIDGAIKISLGKSMHVTTVR